METLFKKFSLIIQLLFFVSANSAHSSETETVRKCDCGFPALVPRIFMGTKLQRHEFRWMAYIVIHNWYGMQYCGGSVIDERHILTAAHCVGGQPASVNVEVYVGHFNRKLMEQALKGKKFEVHQIFVPPDYDADDNLNNDIAILSLKENIVFKGGIEPICLLDTNSVMFKKFTLAGWGKTGPNEGGSDTLMKVKLDFVDKSRCEILSANHYYRQTLKEIAESKYENFRIASRPFYQTHMCAINLQSGGDACKGDSGSPLMFESPESFKWYVVGVVSGGAPCGTTNKFPGWYTNVTYFSSWIRSIAKNAQFCDTF